MIDRIDAFKPGVLDEQLVHYVAKDVADRYRGDARRAIDTLKEAGKIAFDFGDNKIEMKHVLDAEERITRMASEKMLSEYSRHDKYLFLAIDFCAKLTVSSNTGLIYSVYKQICILLNEKPTTFGYVSGVLSVLVDKCLLNAERGFRGNTRIFTLSDEVKNALHILYTPELKQVIDKNLIDLEILINESQKPKKSKNI
jgi:Cdc6-like AAA superfamily ATPase